MILNNNNNKYYLLYLNNTHILLYNHIISYCINSFIQYDM